MFPEISERILLERSDLVRRFISAGSKNVLPLVKAAKQFGRYPIATNARWLRIDASQNYGIDRNGYCSARRHEKVGFCKIHGITNGRSQGPH
jgi:hypothetical protein